MKIVPDTSVIISGELIQQMRAGNLHDSEVIIPQAVLDELQSQASQKKEQGYAGLEEVKRLHAISAEFGITVMLKGEHPTAEEISLAADGRIDSLIKDIARQNQATLYTSDRLQHLVAQAEGIMSVLVRSQPANEELEFLRYFDRETMSVHLKEGRPAMAKKGRPGAFILQDTSSEVLSAKYLEGIAAQILDAARHSDSGTIESKPGASVVQYEDYRIVITRPPFSDGIEITLVRPIVRLAINDYDMPDGLLERFADGARGVLISGSPGSGKSTLASGIADFYHSAGKIVKTLESPRDLQVDAGITQYTKLDDSFENTADILLLVRPDYTIFDEVRRREDFQTFSDLRLAGVGMVGVVHASAPLDAIQRFIGKIELGMIPNVLDTVVYVRDGRIGKVYDLSLCVKVPTGMTESDLARPVIEIRDYTTNTLEHEIYTFGEENVIVPVLDSSKRPGIERLAEEKICEMFKRYDSQAQVEVISANTVRVMVGQHAIPSIIGRGGSNISSIEKSLGVRIDVTAREANPAQPRGDLPFTFSESRNALLLTVGKEYATQYADIYTADRHVTTVRVGRRGMIKIPKRSDAAARIADVASQQTDIRVSLRDS